MGPHTHTSHTHRPSPKKPAKYYFNPNTFSVAGLFGACVRCGLKPQWPLRSSDEQKIKDANVMSLFTPVSYSRLAGTVSSRLVRQPRHSLLIPRRQRTQRDAPVLLQLHWNVHKGVLSPTTLFSNVPSNWIS